MMVLFHNATLIIYLLSLNKLFIKTICLLGLQQTLLVGKGLVGSVHRDFRMTLVVTYCNKQMLLMLNKIIC